MRNFIIDTLVKAISIYTSWYGFGALAWMLLN